jgi:hypothetical protein
MSSIPFDPGSVGRAERQFREAFERLKQCKPQLLPKGTKLTQNNVAKEAGAVPSALRRARFPLLVEEIQAWITEHSEDDSQRSPRQKILAQRGRNRGLRERITELEVQRDDALGKLVCAEARIVELTIENERLTAQVPSPNVTPLRPSDSGGRGSKKPDLREV